MGDQQHLLSAEEVPFDYQTSVDTFCTACAPQLSTTAKEEPGFHSPKTWSSLAGCFFAGTFSLIAVGAIALTFQALVENDQVRGVTGGETIAGWGRTDRSEASFPGIRRDRLTGPAMTPPTTSVGPDRVTGLPAPETQTKPFEATAVTSQPPPLLCSAGLTAVLPWHHPPDGTCDILIYTHVRIEDRKLLAVDDQISYGAFRNACKLYADSTCGLSFDVRFLHPRMFANTDIRDQLTDSMRTAHINHYAIMNIYQQREMARNFSLAAAPVLREFRSLLGSDRRNHKVIFGVGFLDYNEADSVSSLSYLAENTATSDVDVVVIITSVLMSPERSPCTTLPANALTSPSNLLLTMEKAVSMAMSSFGVPSLTVAFSFQMGVLLYHMPRRNAHPTDAIYTECISMAVSDYSAACGVTPRELHREKVSIGLGSNQSFGTTGTVVLWTFDTLQFMIDKANVIMSASGIRANFTWFLFNVHLTDVTGRCLIGGPFERVKGFRDFYSWEWQRLNS